jgi:hypothetical protein
VLHDVSSLVAVEEAASLPVASGPEVVASAA